MPFVVSIAVVSPEFINRWLCLTHLPFLVALLLFSNGDLILQILLENIKMPWITLVTRSDKVTFFQTVCPAHHFNMTAFHSSLYLWRTWWSIWCLFGSYLFIEHPPKKVERDLNLKIQCLSELHIVIPHHNSEFSTEKAQSKTKLEWNRMHRFYTTSTAFQDTTSLLYPYNQTVCSWVISVVSCSLHLACPKSADSLQPKQASASLQQKPTSGSEGCTWLNGQGALLSVP